MNYSLKLVYPVLAIIENENPPAYEPVSLDDDGASLPEMPIATGPKPLDATPGSHTITGSVRNIHRLLRANGGFRAYVRGLACLIAQGFLHLMCVGFFASVLGYSGALVGGLISALALVQFSTAWVHIVISKPSELHFWSRLPEYQRTVRATWRPIVIYQLATQFAGFVPWFLSIILHFKVPRYEPGKPSEVPQNHGAEWKVPLMFVASVLTAIFVTVPAYVVLVRVQASLLPEEDETIIPFDRSFQGKVEPAVIGGKGWVSVRDAWSTFSRAAWRRLIVLYVKVSVIFMAVLMLIGTVVILPEIILIAAHSKVVKE